MINSPHLPQVKKGEWPGLILYLVLFFGLVFLGCWTIWSFPQGTTAWWIGLLIAIAGIHVVIWAGPFTGKLNRAGHKVVKAFTPTQAERAKARKQALAAHVRTDQNRTEDRPRNL